MKDKQAVVRHCIGLSYERASKVNRRYSIRSFARKLEISVSTYSEFMAGKRFMSEELLKRIMTKLAPAAEYWEEFESLPLKSAKQVKLIEEPNEVALDSFRSDDHVYANILKCQEPESLQKFIINIDTETERKLNKAFNDLEEKIASILDGQSKRSEKQLRILELRLRENHRE